MSTIELRKHIIKKLSLIDNDSFLKAIKTIIESKVNEGSLISFLIFKRNGSNRPEAN